MVQTEPINVTELSLSLQKTVLRKHISILNLSERGYYVLNSQYFAI